MILSILALVGVAVWGLWPQLRRTYIPVTPQKHTLPPKRRVPAHSAKKLYNGSLDWIWEKIDTPAIKAVGPWGVSVFGNREHA